jgi:signal transduction histidine kinase
LWRFCACYTPPVKGVARVSALTMLVAAMLVLLPVLAVLQYRWLGQLSDAERERLHRSVRATTTDFTQQIDLEIARVIVGLQLDAATVREEAWPRYADRYAAWHAAATEPAIVRDVSLVDVPRGDQGLRMRRWNAQARVFEPDQWSADRSDAQARIERAYATFTKHEEPLFLHPSEALSPDGSMLVLPLLPVAPAPTGGRAATLVPTFGFTVIRLNPTLIERQLVPAAVARHFGSRGTGEYHLAVVTGDKTRRVIYESERGDAQALASHADVDEGFFGLRPDQFALFRMAASSLRSPDGSRPEIRRNVFFSLVGRRPNDGPARAGHEDGTRWRLLVRHRAGSLEAAVARARQRNLALSFGILVLMAVSVALIVVGARRAQHLARQQIEFVAGVSHELRTPVSVISAAADNLAQGVVHDRARVRQYGSAIQSEARRLADTVERVLQFAGIQAGRIMGQPVPLRPVDIVEHAANACRGLLDDAHATIEIDVPPDLPDVRGDLAALRSAVQNLVANAVKYSGASPSISITARRVRVRRAHEITIAVEDHGLGIPAEDLPHIFEPFYRGADVLSRQIHGNGLGLSIVKRIVEAHGGRVAVTSARGAGSTFIVHLPVAEGTRFAAGDAVEHEATA